jgi:hypothetical protein
VTEATKDLAKDVAKQLDRRRLRRRLIILAVWLAAMIAALYYVRCGRGTGGGEGSQAGTGSAVKRCALRVDAKGINVDGKSVNRETAVALCKQVGGAEVVVTGDAREGDWAALRAALSTANVDILLHEAR